GIFVLVKTSNPSSGELQDIMVEGTPLYEIVGKKVADWGKELIGSYGYSSCGAVVGATYKGQAERLRKQLENVFFLIPGYGAQGATGKDIVSSFDSRGLGGVVNASRSIICAHKKGKYHGENYLKAAKGAALDMKADILSSLEEAGKPMIKE
ncbi:MAG: orotidine 5'-phosphate decarboxylase, partial [Clostridia bacterium]|nr:orotidine 5'-phosphate decarboxylase [Clostridia bacterium]